MLKHDIQDQLIKHIQTELNPDFIILFGSYAKGTNHAESDIDLAYFSEQQLSAYDRFILTGYLAEIAGCEVDLVDLKQIDTVFTMQIFS